MCFEEEILFNDERIRFSIAKNRRRLRAICTVIPFIARGLRVD